MFPKNETLGLSRTFERPFEIQSLVLQKRRLFKSGSQVRDFDKPFVGKLLLGLCVCAGHVCAYHAHIGGWRNLVVRGKCSLYDQE